MANMPPLIMKLAMPVPPHPNLPPQAREGANESLREFHVNLPPARGKEKIVARVYLARAAGGDGDR